MCEQSIMYLTLIVLDNNKVRIMIQMYEKQEQKIMHQALVIENYSELKKF